MPPKKKNAAQKAVTLTDDQQQSILERMNNKPCINCTDNHEAYDCKKLTGPVSMMSWIYTAFTKAPTLTAARKYIKTLQDEKNGVPKATTDASPTSTTDVLPTAMNELSLASTAAQPLVQSPVQPSDESPIQPSVQAPVQPSVQPDIMPDASGTYFDPEIAYATLDQSEPSPDLLNVSSISREEPVDLKSYPSERAPYPNSVGEGNVFLPKLRPVTAADAPFPMRKELNSTQTQVLTNHFEVKFKPDTKFFVYQIVGIPTGRNKRNTKLIIKTAIQAWDFLRDNQDSFAKDNNGIIVAWKNLHDALGVPDQVGENKGYHYTGEIEVAGDEWNGVHIADGRTEIALKFKFRGEMDLDKIQAYTDPGRKHNYVDLPKFNFDPIATALNVIISNSLAEDVFQLQSNKFFLKSGHALLGFMGTAALCTIRGYFYTVKPGMGKILPNVNAATSAFYTPITVAEFMRDNTFASNDREGVLRGLRVHIEYNRKAPKDPKDRERVARLNKTQARIKTIKGFGNPIGHADMKFKKGFVNAEGNFEEEKFYTRVIDHMKNIFGVSADPGLNAVNVGTDDDPCYYPQEFLRILPYQQFKKLVPEKLTEGMLKTACQGPQQSRALIEAEGLKKLGIVQKDGLQQFRACPQLLIEPRMLQVPATIMDRPVILYSNNSDQKHPDDQNAKWNLRGKLQFLDSPKRAQELKYYMFVDPSIRANNTVGIYRDAINDQARNYGVASKASCLGCHTLPNLYQPHLTHDKLVDGFGKTITTLLGQKPGGTLAILLLAKHSIPVYSAFKDCTDRYLGLQALCMTEEKNLQGGSCKVNVAPYVANVIMKVNLKTGGRNHTAASKGGNGKIEDTLKDTLLLGADVTHPGPGSLTGCPSIAVIVGSVDGTGGKCLGSMRLQHRSKTEMIDEVKPMVMERLKAWVKYRKSYPTNVLYYRDGVSTGQYEQVKKDELVQIRQAYEAIVKKPLKKLTAIVAIKRHHTRLYPVTGQGMKNGNCIPGTMVDSGITSPYFSDFYLQSHHGLQGTAIPTHYFTLVNEMGLSDSALQELTHKLCYTYVRATLGVSYAPPAYYADRLCDRGRCYLRQWFAPDKSSRHYQNYLEQKAKIEKSHKDKLKLKVAQLKKPAVQNGHRKPRKQQQQKDLERESRDETTEAVEKHFLNQAKAYLEIKRKDGPGPWHPSLDDTMFWM